MKTLKDLYKENPEKYAEMVAKANEEHKTLIVKDDELALSESSTFEKDYKYFRVKEYPRIAEQLDMIWHAIDEGVLDKNSEFYKVLKEVKEKYPKE